MRSWRRITAWLLWLSYAGLYFFALMGVPFIGTGTPLVMGAPLLLAAIVFAIIYWPVRRRLTAGIVAVATGNLLVALLLVGGPGTVWTLAGWRWFDPPGLPNAAVFASFVVGLLVPLTVTVTVLRALQRDRAILTVASAG